MSNISLWKREELDRLKSRMDRLFDTLCADFGLPGFGPFGNGPRVRVSENDTELVIIAELPGVKPDDLDVGMTGDVLEIRGEVEREIHGHTEKKTFETSFRVPCRVQADKAEATLEDGVLTITLPKDTSDDTKRVCIACK